MPSTEQMIAEVSAQSSESDQTQATTGATPATETSDVQQAIQEFEYQANGKTVKEPIDMILKRASQGYNYAQHMQEVKTQAQQIQEREAKALALETKYGEIDKYAQEHPEWNDHLHKTWESRFDVTGGQTQENPQAANIPSQFLNEFNDMKAVVDTIKAERADQAYQSSLDKVQQTYPDVDFKATDPDTGMSLEQQVLNFAQENGIQRFEPAFKAFYADKLIEKARLEAKDQMAGDLKQRSKAGLLGTSQAPAQGNANMDFPANYKNMSLDQVHNWIVDKYVN